MDPPLAIVAGGGELPVRVWRACQAQGRPVVVLALEGQAQPELWPSEASLTWTRLGRAGEAAVRLLDQGITHLCLAGGVRRPSLTHLLALWPDWRTAAFLARVATQALGDDSLLRAILRELEAHGFVIEAPHAVIGGLLAPVGVLGRVCPDDQGWRDLIHGFQVAKALGGLDVGQGAVVQQGVVLALEAIEGTDVMLGRCASLAREGAGGVLVKAAKPRQDRRVDLPAVGVRTVENASRAGLRGLGVEAGAALLIDTEALVARADALGMFVVGLSGEETPPCS
ncbi:LpxI family protein [Pararhodospirillum oryzae]|uniref:LpxI family protein n=1 Tax=Pararhodospirillum oryzae TaxID=478448 RepID=UPI0011BDFF55|nr:UDP-2,3-diacylglucosamine diphosphatase LpxI [Pararhodospirillum oryzae]